MLVLGSVATLLLSNFRSNIPLVIAGLFVFGIGYIHGGTAFRAPVECEWTGEGLVGLVKVTTVREGSIQYVIETGTGCTLLVNAARFPEYLPGQHVGVREGAWQKVKDLPAEQQSYAKYLQNRGIDTVVGFASVTAMGDDPSLVAKVHIYFRHAIEKIFVEPEASLVAAILVADQGTIPKSIVDNFRVSGVTHILAISGSNVSLLAGVLYLLLALLPVGAFMQTFSLLTFLWVYIIIIGLPVSAVRAVIFWMLTLLGYRWQRLTSLTAVLLLVSSAMIAVDPLLLLDIGWQLSFAAVIGILWMLWVAKPVINRQCSLFWRGFLMLLLTTLGATMWTWPIVSYSFGNVSLVGLFANILVVPASGLLMLCSLVTLLVGYVWFPGALVVSFAVRAIVKWLVTVTDILSGLPWAEVELQLPGSVIVLYYYCLFAFTLLLVKQQNRSWREVWQ